VRRTAAPRRSSRRRSVSSTGLWRSPRRRWRADRMGERLGVIGLGIMGKPMARTLLNAGFDVTVHSRGRGPVEELAAEGATPAVSPAEVARASDVLITMLPDTPQVEEVLLGESDGVLGAAAAGTLVIDMSTIDPAATRVL